MFGVKNGKKLEDDALQEDKGRKIHFNNSTRIYLD